MRAALHHGGDDAGIGLLLVQVHAGSEHGPSKANDDVVLGHAIFMLVDLLVKGNNVNNECQAGQ